MVIRDYYERERQRERGEEGGKGKGGRGRRVAGHACDNDAKQASNTRVYIIDNINNDDNNIDVDVDVDVNSVIVMVVDTAGITEESNATGTGTGSSRTACHVDGFSGGEQRPRQRAEYDVRWKSEARGWQRKGPHSGRPVRPKQALHTPDAGSHSTPTPAKGDSHDRGSCRPISYPARRRRHERQPVDGWGASCAVPGIRGQARGARCEGN